MQTTTTQVDLAWIPPESNGILNSVTGLLSKAADTAIDVWGMKEQGKVIGSLYPTGQVNPAAAPAINKSEAPKMNYTPYIIGGGVLVVALVLIVAISKK